MKPSNGAAEKSEIRNQKSEIFQSFLFPLAHPTCHSDRGSEANERRNLWVLGESSSLPTPQFPPLWPFGPSVEMTHWWLLPALGGDTVEAVEWSGRKIRNPKSEIRNSYVWWAENSEFKIPNSEFLPLRVSSTRPNRGRDSQEEP